MAHPQQVEAVSLLETITGAYHAANCEHPNACPNTCHGRMPVGVAVAVITAVREKLAVSVERL